MFVELLLEMKILNILKPLLAKWIELFEQINHLTKCLGDFKRHRIKKNIEVSKNNFVHVDRNKRPRIAAKFSFDVKLEKLKDDEIYIN